ncbi:MAG: DUF4019 domain-containing protein [Alphaproteobacteria bacterium]|jgi:hypothetical protein|nr:DUF4019 domain-containing protein [Alphaproteobacteria bacterium]MDP6563767.1 DUF4019 domain-containing protein [Alphaproteobacteria bacterium]MDP6814099.1 DUF4019 domain-containing protein [Alphaproteobacteria bacterium]
MVGTLARSSLAALAICLLGTTVTATDAREAAALRAARAWLALVDAGNFDASWHAGAGYFRRAIGKEQWREAMEGVRRPLGNVISRKLKGKTFATELPGAPDGQYVVIQFDTSFKNKRSAIETVTPMLDAGGDWRVAGYFIK